MRIVAGRLGGRVLKPPAAPTRPTTDRVREAWFNRLADRTRGARVLDLFAGSGALGLEAVSRGAAHVTFIENAGRALAVLKGNIAALEVEDLCEVQRRDAIGYVRSLNEDAFDIVCADPPYGSGAAEELVRLFEARPFGAILCVEHAATDPMPSGDTRRYGDAAVTFVDRP